MKKRVRIWLIVLLSVFAVFLVYDHRAFYKSSVNDVDTIKTEGADEQEESRVTKKILIEPGSTYGEIMESAGVGTSVHTDILKSAKDIYDLSNIKAGEEITLVFDGESGDLIQLIYQTDTINELFVTRKEERSSQDYADENSMTRFAWYAEERPIDYEIRTKKVSATINSSLYSAGIDNGMDERAIIALAEIFQWTIDFAWDVRMGDSFSVIYEERYRNGEYIMPGKIISARYTNKGSQYFAYYFEESEDNKGYFDEKGNSLRKMFLKAPLEFKYISSGFTTRARFVSSNLGWTKSHRGIDYAAVMGTPIRAVGDGTIISAGWNTQGYGNRISIRHNETYTTNYAHLSKIFVKKGQKVKQGDIIGAVGSTGFSTGPHLHYELVKFGTKINPLTEELPEGESISENNMSNFQDIIRKYKDDLSKVE